jgi:putative SOS response-associated peptidase YedK
MAPIHDRMPVILPPSAWDAWLDPTNDDTEALAKLLVLAPADLLVARPVSTAVNSTRNNGPDLVAEATPDQLVG